MNNDYINGIPQDKHQLLYLFKLYNNKLKSIEDSLNINGINNKAEIEANLNSIVNVKFDYYDEFSEKHMELTKKYNKKVSDENDSFSTKLTNLNNLFSEKLDEISTSSKKDELKNYIESSINKVEEMYYNCDFPEDNKNDENDKFIKEVTNIYNNLYTNEYEHALELEYYAINDAKIATIKKKVNKIISQHYITEKYEKSLTELYDQYDSGEIDSNQYNAKYTAITNEMSKPYGDLLNIREFVIKDIEEQCEKINNYKATLLHDDNIEDIKKTLNDFKNKKIKNGFDNSNEISNINIISELENKFKRFSDKGINSLIENVVSEINIDKSVEALLINNNEVIDDIYKIHNEKEFSKLHNILIKNNILNEENITNKLYNQNIFVDLNRTEKTSTSDTSEDINNLKDREFSVEYNDREKGEYYEIIERIYQAIKAHKGKLTNYSSYFPAEMSNVKKEILRTIAEELYDIYGDDISDYSIHDYQKESRFNFDIIKTSTRYHIICNDKKYENNNVFELCKLDINGNNIELHEFDIGTNMETVKDNNKVINVKKGFKANKLIKNNYEKKITNDYLGSKKSNINQKSISLLAMYGTIYGNDNFYIPNDYVKIASDNNNSLFDKNNDKTIDIYVYDKNKNIIKKSVYRDQIKGDIIGLYYSKNKKGNLLTNVKCSYSEDNGISHIGEYIKDINSQRTKKVEKINDENIKEQRKSELNVINDTKELVKDEYIISCNKDGNYNGCLNDNGHLDQFKFMFEDKNAVINSFNMKCRNKSTAVKRKRTTNLCTLSNIKITENKDITDNILSLLSKLSIKSSEASNLYTEIKKQIEEKNVSYDQEEIWSNIINIYEKYMDKFELTDQNDILRNIQNLVNIYAEDLSNNEKYDKNKFISKEFVEKLNSKLVKYYINHEQKMKENNLSGDEEIYKRDFYPNNKSIYYKEVLIDSINELYKSIKYNNDDINIGMVFNINNENIINDERLDEIKNLCDNIKNMEIDEKEKDAYKKKLLNVYKKIEKINSANIIDNYYTGEINNNFEIINKLSNTLVEKLKKEFPDDEEIQNLESNTSFDQYTSTNIINLDYIKELYDNDYLEYISNEVNSKNYIKSFIDNLKSKVLSMKQNDDYLDEDVYKSIKRLENNINKKIKQIKNYDSENNHFEEVEHFMKLLNNYNELISVCILQNKILTSDNQSKSIQHIELDEDMMNRVNYIATKKINQGYNSIIKENRNEFGVESIENSIDKNDANSISYNWGNNKIFAPSKTDIDKLIDKSTESKANAVLEFMSKASEDSDLSDLIDGYKIKSQLLEHQTSVSRNSEDINEINTVSEKMGESDFMNNLETYQDYNTRTFVKYLKAASEYDDYIQMENLKYNQDGTINVSEIYLDEEGKPIINNIDELLHEMGSFIETIGEYEDKMSKKSFSKYQEKIEKSISKLEKHINNCLFKLSDSMDRTNDERYDKALEQLKNLVNSAKPLISIASEVCKNPNIESNILRIDNQINKFQQMNENSIKSNKDEKSEIEKFAERAAFTILAAGREDGSLAKELNENGELVPISINVIENGEEVKKSIKDIIPSLRNLEGKALEDKFRKLYDMAVVQYSEHFETYFDEEKGKLLYKESPLNTIKKGNILSRIIKSYNTLDDGNIEYFELAPEEINKFISEVDENKLDDIDINNINESESDIIRKYWEDDDEESNYDNEKKQLYKVMAVHCIKSSKCREDIVNYNSKDKGKSIDNFTFIIHNDESQKSISSFALQKNEENKKYTVDDHHSPMEYKYSELNQMVNNRKVERMTIDNTEYIVKPDANGNIVKPEVYAIKSSEGNGIYNSKSIEQKYEIQNNGEYDINLVKAEALNLRIDNSNLNIKDENNNIGEKLLNKRNSNESNKYCKLSNDEVNIFNNYSNLIINDDLCEGNQGMLHYNEENEFNSGFNELKTSINLQNEVKTIKNHRNGCLSGGNSVEEKLIESLKILKKYDSKNIIVRNDEKSISNPKELCKNAETLTNVLNISLESFENIDNMSDEESLDYRYKSANYLNHKSIRNINKYDIDDITKHDDDGVVHKKGVTFIKVETPTLNIDPESKYVNDELHETYNNLHDLINEYDQDITNINLVDDMDINNKSGKENRNKELKYLLKKFKNMKATGSKQKKIFDKTNFEKNDFVNNSESVYKLTNGIVKVQNHLLSYKDTISGIEKINVKSTNILNSDHVIGEVDIEDYIFNDPNSKMYVKRYFDKLKDDLYDINTDEEHINSKINIMKRYKQPDGHYHEAYHLIELINCYNELVATTLSFDRENNEINYIYISDDPDLYEIFNHLRVKIKNKIENKIIKSNPDNFNTEKYQKYIFGDSSVYEASYKDYNKIIKDNKVTSNTEVLKNFVDSSTNNHQLLGIKESYNLGYKITENELPNYRDEDMVNSVNELESKQTETRFINNIIADAKIENINNNKKFTIDSVIDEDQKENVQKQIENVCLNERNEIIKYSGVTPSSSYEEMNEGYNSFESKSINLMKRISNKDDTNEKDYEKLSLPKKLVTHNKLNSDKINSESPRIKNPPINKHKYGNKKKRNIEYIKYFHRYY
ncbi:hypothetical protein H8356DRAFT_1755714 [Neocallimastix lanati (nom. inval.)]|nr:hypothetical protein H8356DRAFT_1755714 [Neocallimastix sp. JGI-2020a]